MAARCRHRARPAAAKRHGRRGRNASSPMHAAVGAPACPRHPRAAWWLSRLALMFARTSARCCAARARNSTSRHGAPHERSPVHIPADGAGCRAGLCPPRSASSTKVARRSPPRWCARCRPRARRYPRRRPTRRRRCPSWSRPTSRASPTPPAACVRRSRPRRAPAGAQAGWREAGIELAPGQAEARVALQRETMRPTRRGAAGQCLAGCTRSR